MNHTPGPWDFFIGNANGRGLIRIEAGNDSPEAGKHIASMPRGASCEANARLIAAAPDMLEALIEVYSAWRHTDNIIDPDADGYEILNKIKSIIERATGRKIEEVIK